MAVALNVKIEGLEVLQKRFRSSPDVLNRESRIAMQKSVDIFLTHVTGRTPVNTEALRGSITTEVRGSSLSGLQGEVGTNIIYGLPVEFGRKPGRMPPPEALEIWAIRKGIIGPGEDLRQVGFLMARAIAAWGTKGKFMFRDGFKAGLPTVQKIWNDLPDKIVQALATQ